MPLVDNEPEDIIWVVIDFNKLSFTIPNSNATFEICDTRIFAKNVIINQIKTLITHNVYGNYRRFTLCHDDIDGEFYIDWDGITQSFIEPAIRSYLE